MTVPSAPRIGRAGDSALLLELDAVIAPEVNARAIAIAAAVRAEARPGVRDVVSTFRSVAVYFDPLVTDCAALLTSLERACGSPGKIAQGRTIDVPVLYGGAFGPDLGDVAAFARLSTGEVIDRHAATLYRVFMLGFLPGFTYMGVVEPQIAAPRRAAPRVRVAAGSVGIAGAQTGIYPRESPGGWQIIGRTPLPVFDPERTPASLFAPGDSVRFVPVDPVNGVAAFAPDRVRRTTERPADSDVRHITVLRPGLFTTIQDTGRWGHQVSGVPVSGALDQFSHRVANAAVGNDREAATLEVTLVGPELRFEQAATIAVAGADLGATVDGARVPLNTATRCRPGGVLRFGERRAGARAYVAVNGGIVVPAVLGSRATHVASAVGGMAGRRLAAGDRLPVGTPIHRAAGRVGHLTPIERGESVRLRVLPGPQVEFFPDDAIEILQRTRFRVAPQSDRMGFRLEGGHIPRLDREEMISDATFSGALQVPTSGEPILLQADRQTTGGYPQIATVISADLPRAAQLAPGDPVEFQVCSRAEAVTALVAQEGKLLAIG
jgi:antagonist of KipI